MMTERNAEPNTEPEVEGHMPLRKWATEADQPQPVGGEGNDVAGHATTKFRATETPAPGEGEPEVEGHGIVKYKASEADQPQPAGGEGAEVEGHATVKIK